MKKKFQIYVKIVWGLIIIFALVGAVFPSHRMTGTYIGIVTACMWCVTRILSELFDALEELKEMRKNNDKDSDSD